MDVTSLLNANAAGQQKKEEKEISKTPPRNRTPWDAGGYSLPINTISAPTTPSQLGQKVVQHDDLQLETPRSPHHKFSDSRSSLSSFTSSLQSTSHSRFSSMSTVSSVIQPMNNILAESMALDSATKPQPFDLESEKLPDSHIRSSSTTQHQGSTSPTGSLDALAIVAEDRQARRQSEPTSPMRMEIDMMSLSKDEEGKTSNKSQSIDRPSSPSDAILIKRSMLPSLRLETGEEALAGLGQMQTYRNYLSAPPESHYQSLIQGRTHKRALSAPDFTGRIAQRFAMPDYSAPGGAESSHLGASGSSPIGVAAPAPITTAGSALKSAVGHPMGPRAELTPPSSQHPDNASPTSYLQYAGPDTPPANNMEPEKTEPVCMYIANCDTGSTLRKAVSHIFGRNKMCTRLIPDHIWVFYCRKHYQRSRYRNPKEYAKLQCDLVQKQIRKIRDWSENNKKYGLPGEVIDWELAVRKREAKRLNDKKAASRKRTASAAFADSSDEGEDGGREPSTAVPAWLVAQCRKGYTTKEVLKIFYQLHEQILNDVHNCFPDIEILPQISVDQNGPKEAKGYSKRGATGHKRSQSLGVGRSTYNSVDRRMNQQLEYQTDRRMSQSSVWASGRGVPFGLTSFDGYDAPFQKRYRPNEIEDRNLPGLPKSRMGMGMGGERPVEARRMQLPHRPGFPSIDEHEHEAGDYYAQSPVYHHQPLPAPIAQRHSGQSMAAHLEISPGYAYGARRPGHRRSFSEMPSMHERGAFQTVPASGYSYESPIDRQEQEQSKAAYMTAAEPRGQPGRSMFGHSRHQSMPVAQHQYQGPSMHGSRESQPPQSNGYSQGYAQGHHGLPPVIRESLETQKLYGDRR